MADELIGLPSLYTRQEWQRMALLAIVLFAAHALTLLFLPAVSFIYPAAAIGLAGLFFSGARLWPGVFLGMLAAGVAVGHELPLVYLVPTALTLAAALGAHFLRKLGVDPIYRTYRDAFYTIGTVLVVSLILPTLLFLAPAHEAWRWSYAYVANVFVFLAMVPMLLRWCAKLRFRRPPAEAVETLLVFTVLIAINTAIFGFSIEAVYGVSLTYLLLIPFFWIAIRLRPRFVTLAVFVTSIFAVESVVLASSAASLPANLFSIELFLIALAVAFYIIVALEEERRLNTNLMRSQLMTLENAVSRISSESQAKNDFIAILAHELRNPLAPVVSAIELMKIKGTQSHEEAESLEVMEASMQTVRRLLDDLLDISRISEGKVAIKREIVDVGHVIRRAVVSTAHHYKERHQTLTFTGSRKPLTVEGDPVRLEQVFSNLLTNASKYSNSGDTVTLTVTDVDGAAEVRITDQGVGIPKDAIETIFLPFHQLDHGQRSKKGLGIGLALVHSFVSMHNGTVTAVSEGNGLGSTFIVRLPLSDASPVKAAKTPRSRRDLPNRKAGPSVLVVDDNDAAAAGIGRLLELQGCSVFYAYSGSQALELAEEMPTDVVILDIGMQDQDGYSVARTLRTRGYAGTLIALSGFSTPEAREKGEAAGFDHYLVKPAGLADLRKILPTLH
ncbi:MAG TPA: ATP-binding protein [Candidatus Paceibacterota bacterium]|jgi:signal transduction histidine kinase/CheY-like chemotaxis protein